MKVQTPFNEPARLIFHLDAGYSRIELIRLRCQWEIPTNAIPIPLRHIGAQFLVIAPRFSVEDTDSADEIRQKIATLQISELATNDQLT